ncbi:DNA recombination protein RmuC [bacterium]|nr:DNA recombination protein RmuC [bacterium]|tara:strand:- start:22448 stop:23491 length:1044 start_codon:yes stop_codon:yes gene_type:complete
MEEIFFVLAGILGGVLGAGAVGYLFIRNQKGDNKEEGSLLLQQLNELSRTLDTKLGESDKKIQEATHRQFTESKNMIRDITEELTSIKETNKQVVSFADQLQKLQDVLQNPKQRGILGEYYLESVLQNVLPTGSFKMQYPFKNGDIVDAVVIVKEKIVPVDSKFSLENYNRMAGLPNGEEKEKVRKLFLNDLKLRIQETSKYIKPEEGTTDFAFMFIPSEGIYYDLLANQVGAGDESIMQRAAREYKVIIVSPTSFLAYLQTVLQGLNAMEIEEKAKDIIKNVGKLRRHIDKYEEYHRKLGNSLATTVNQYNFSRKELGKVDKDVLKITGESSDIEVELLERPDTEE